MNIINFIIMTCFVIYSKAGVINHSVAGERNHPPKYEFQYSVHDSNTGDIKDHFEHRQGDYLVGRYSLIEPGGLRRVVEYSSDPILGFNAQVRHELPNVQQINRSISEEFIFNSSP